MKAAISTEDIPDSELIELARSVNVVDIDVVPQVSTKEIKVFNEDANKKKVALIDCGVKKNIINNFWKCGIGSCFVPIYNDYKNYFGLLSGRSDDYFRTRKS